MSYPKSFSNRPLQDLRLGIKSSYYKIRNSIALLYCMYLAMDKQASFAYGESSNNTQKLNQKIEAWIGNYFEGEDPDTIKGLCNDSCLIVSQIEAIQVCFELVFRLAKISFSDKDNCGSERTGGKRYPKSVSFTSNIILLDSIISSHGKDDIKDFLWAWLNNNSLEESDIDFSVRQFLTILSEKCMLKMRFENQDDLIFLQEGIYRNFLEGADSVDISEKEKVGTFRVLWSFISEGLHLFLRTENGKIVLQSTVKQKDFSNYITEISNYLDLSESRTLENGGVKTLTVGNISDCISDFCGEIKYLTAMRTKPFLLLAGISGTGKSRIVKQMAFESCPNIPVLRCDKTAPGNYELIEVKPNWHDSIELLGYESEIGGAHFVLTPFIKFLVKAMRYENKAPFFVCMDEMNLAPVEQYFAEFLSVLESRKLLPNGTITSEPLVKADIFTKYENTLKDELFDIKRPKTKDAKDDETEDPAEDYGDFNAVYGRLKADGLRLPSNLIVIGTVNMDETTHQFSRKVIDRAMTIEMNIEDAETPFKNFFDGTAALDYPNGEPADKNLFLPKIVQASEALLQLSNGDATYLKDTVPQLLHALNAALNGTPFKIAYRVQNELILYFYSLREEKSDDTAETLLATAIDAILMMKVLPRIEGDEDLLEEPLKELAVFTENYPNSAKKIAEMQERLSRVHFTSFWP